MRVVMHGWGLRGHRSLPQTLPATMRATAPVGYWVFGSSTGCGRVAQVG